MAESQRPSPSPTVLSQTQQNKTEPKQTKTSDHQRGSEDSPLIVSISGTVPTKTEITNQTNHTNDETTLKRRDILFNILLVIFNGLLAFFTFRLYRSTEKLWQSTDKQIQLAREEFIASHRPRLILRHVTMKGPTDDFIPIEDGKPIMIRWTLVNSGDSPAQIIGSGVTAFLGSKIFDVSDLQGRKLETLGEDTINTGGRSARTYTMTTEDIKFSNYGQLFNALIDGNQAIYFWGFVEYSDLNGIERRTAFCRRYDVSAERFIIVDDPDHEYAD